VALPRFAPAGARLQDEHLPALPAELLGDEASRNARADDDHVVTPPVRDRSVRCSGRHAGVSSV